MPATVEHIGPGLVPPPHLVAPVPLGVADHPYGHPYHRTPTSIVRDRYLGPVVHPTAFSRRELLGFGHDAERFDPDRIVHSAEQLPLRVPRAFNERQEDEWLKDQFFVPYPKYHAKGSRHSHADFDKFPGKVDYHEMPRLSDRIRSRDISKYTKKNEVEMNDEPANFFANPYHGKTEIYHEAHIQD